MQKKISAILIVMGVNAYAATNTQNESSTYLEFQKFDRQYNLGFATTSGQLTNGKSGGTHNTQFMNLEVERLFNIGIWLDVNASLLTYYVQPVDKAVPTTGVTTGSQPQFGGLNAKLGYAFPIMAKHLLLTPYAQLGRNVNLASYTLAANSPTTNITENYYWSFAFGGRLEYRVNDVFDFYFDQNAMYNASQAPTTQGLPANNYYSYTSTLGAKFNLYRNFQLAAQVFYNNDYFTSSLSTANGIALVPQNDVGGLVSVGLTY